MNEMTTQIKCQSCHAVLEVMGQAGGVVRCEYCGTQNLLSKEVRRVVAEDNHQFFVALYRAIAAEFNLDELDTLIVRVSGEVPSIYRLSPDDIPGRTRDNRAMELAYWCRRRGQLQPLVDTVLAIRPTIDINVYMR